MKNLFCSNVGCSIHPIFSPEFRFDLNHGMGYSETHGIPRKEHFFPRENENVPVYTADGKEFQWNPEVGYLNSPARNNSDAGDPDSKTGQSGDLTQSVQLGTTGATGEAAITPDPDDRNFDIQRLEDISNSPD